MGDLSHCHVWLFMTFFFKKKKQKKKKTDMVDREKQNLLKLATFPNPIESYRNY